MDAHGGTTTYSTAPDGGAPTLPPVMWALAWTFVAGQLLALARSGFTDHAEWQVSSLIGVVVVTFFAHGVLRARLVRLWIVAVLLAVGAVAELATLVQDRDGWAAASFALLTVQLYLLNAYTDTDWFRRHRTTPRGGPRVGRVLLLAVVVGILAGVIDIGGATVGFHVSTSF